MWAMILKEFRQVRRDRRTLAMMIVMPTLLLVILGYAASFNVTSIPVAVAGPQANAFAGRLKDPFDVVSTRPGQGKSWATEQLRDGNAAVAMVTGSTRPQLLIDGTQIFTAQATLAHLAQLGAAVGAGGSAAGGSAAVGSAAVGSAAVGSAAVGSAASGPDSPGSGTPNVTILYNPTLSTSDIMIPGLAGVVMVFIGTIITSLGVVRERQAGTLEQLAVMPLRPADVFLGKIVPYFAVAAVDLGLVLGVGIAIFGVPFRGSAAVFALGSLLFLFVTLGLGVLISSVSQNQGQAIQLAIMVMLPQIMLSGLIFPLSSIAAGVRWIAYILPLTYFNEISRGVMLKAEPLGSLWAPLVFLAVLGAVVFTLATWRFRGYLAPGRRHRDHAVARPASEAA